MKHLYMILIFLLMLSDISAVQAPDSLKYKSLPPAAFLTAYQKSEKGMMIDVREFFEYKKSRLKDELTFHRWETLIFPLIQSIKTMISFFTARRDSGASG